MQPYTPHGDSNFSLVSFMAMTRGCNLIPLTGTVTEELKEDMARAKMQPYTPHGDSNIMSSIVAHLLDKDAALYPSRGQ